MKIYINHTFLKAIYFKIYTSSKIQCALISIQGTKKDIGNFKYKLCCKEIILILFFVAGMFSCIFAKKFITTPYGYVSKNKHRAKIT